MALVADTQVLKPSHSFGARVLRGCMNRGFWKEAAACCLFAHLCTAMACDLGHDAARDARSSMLAAEAQCGLL